MVDQRHKTTVEIAVDDRQVRQLGGALRTALSTDQIDRFNRGLDQMLDRLRKAQPAAGALPGGRMGAAPPRLPPPPPPPRAPAEPEWSKKLIDAIGKMPGARAVGVGAGVGAAGGVMLGNYASRAGGMGAAVMGGEGVTERFLGGIPLFGQAMGAAVGAARRYAQEFISFRQSVVGTVGRTGFAPGTGGEGLGRYGFMPSELPQRFAGIAEASRMRGEGLREFGREALIRERRFGIGAESSAKLAGAIGVGTQGVDATRAQAAVQNAIKTGVAAGFRISDLGDVIDDIASDISQLRSKGIMVDDASMMTLRAMFGATGKESLQGAAATSAAKAAEDVLRSAPERGDFGAALAMQLARKGGKTPYEAFEMLEKSPQELVPEFIKAITGMGGTEEAQAFGLRSAFQGKIGYRQARELIQASQAGTLSPEQIETAFGKRTGELGEAAGVAEAQMGGAPATAAAMEAKRLGYGGQAVAAIQQLQTQELELAELGVTIGKDIAKISAETIKWVNILKDRGVQGVISELGAIGEKPKRFVDVEPGAAIPQEDLQDRMIDLKNAIEGLTNAFNSYVGAAKSVGNTVTDVLEGIGRGVAGSVGGIPIVSQGQ